MENNGRAIRQESGGFKGCFWRGFDEKNFEDLGWIIEEAFDPDHREEDREEEVVLEAGIKLELEKQVAALVEKRPAYQELRNELAAAAASPVGGIDLNANHLDLNTQGQIISAPLPVNLQNFNNTPFGGFTPVIFEIVPIPNFPLHLGLDTNLPKEKITSTNTQPADERCPVPTLAYRLVGIPTEAKPNVGNVPSAELSDACVGNNAEVRRRQDNTPKIASVK